MDCQPINKVAHSAQQLSPNSFSLSKSPSVADSVITPRESKKKPQTPEPQLTKPIEPKLLNKHQLKDKHNRLGAQRVARTPLDALLKAPVPKPKRAKKVKQLTKRGKQSHHR